MTMMTYKLEQSKVEFKASRERKATDGHSYQ
jgi:hypothetical protein